MSSSVSMGGHKASRAFPAVMAGVVVALLALAAGGVAFGFTLERLLGRL